MDGIGSTWGRWDLHIHSPLSIEQGYGGDTPAAWEEFFKSIEALPSDVVAIGINDYYFLDGFEKTIKAKRDQGRLQNIKKIFPVIEFRIDTFASASLNSLSKVNMHFIFDINEKDIEANIKEIRESFIEQIHLGQSGNLKNVPLKKENLIKYSPDQTLKSGLSELIPNTNQVLELARTEKWLDRTIKVLGFREWNDLDKKQQVKPHKQLLSREASAYFTAGGILADHSKKTNILDQFGSKPLLHSGDVHDFDKLAKNYDCLTWIKAVPSFRGLQQALKENRRRIFLGVIPPELQTRNLNRHNSIKRISFEATKQENKWFDATGSVPINDGLVAIIGNKGSGKSALSDSLAFALDTDSTKMGFLYKERFLKDPARNRTRVVVEMADNTSNSRPLSDQISKENKPKVRYLSQNFVEDLCSEIASVEKLQKTIDEILFQHLPANIKGSSSTIAEVVVQHTAGYDMRLQILQSELHTVNKDICELEFKLSSDEKQRLIAAETEIKNNLTSLIKTQKPPFLAKPSTDSAKKYSAIQQRADSLSKEIRDAVESVDDLISKINGAKNQVEQIREHVNFVRGRVESINAINAQIPLAYRLDPSVISITIDDAALDKSFAKIQGDTARAQLRRRIKDRALGRIESVLKSASQDLTQIERTYSQSRQTLAEWRRRVRHLIGSGSKPALDTLRGVRRRLDAINNEYPKLLTELEARRTAVSKNIAAAKYSREIDLAKLYGPAETHLENVSKQLGLETNDLLSIESDFRLASDFNKKFCDYINRNRKGTFYQERAEHMLNVIRQDAITADKDSFVEFASRLHQALQFDVSETGNHQPTGIDSQIKNVDSKLEFYDFLYGLDYAKASFTIKFGQRSLDVLSPGERGLLLLAFFFLLDMGNEPLIIDQPEENLDNETIYTKLVTFIKHARNRRQTILVTHNPNLAVACDADQVIVANIDKGAGNQISYFSGALEEERIKDACLRILEGTEPAFQKRGDTYNI